MLLKDKKTVWDGVRNYQARNNLQLMKKGDMLLFYHSQEGAKEIVGLASLSKEAFPDPTSDDPRWLAVEIKPVKAFKTSVSISEMKKEISLAELSLFKQSRLSVMPVTESEFNSILKMSGTQL